MVMNHTLKIYDDNIKPYIQCDDLQDILDNCRHEILGLQEEIEQLQNQDKTIINQYTPRLINIKEGQILAYKYIMKLQLHTLKKVNHYIKYGYSKQ